jgi:hypothetical protein
VIAAERGQHDDGGAVLVVVEHRDVQAVPQPGLDVEAARRRDVLEVDAPERRRDVLHDAHDLVGVGGVEHDRHGVQAGELAEQRRLALHHRQRRGRADVAEPEHGGAVADDGDQPRPPRVPAGQLGLVRDRAAHLRDTGRVGQRQGVPIGQRELAAHRQLAALVHLEHGRGRVVMHCVRLTISVD